MNRRLRLALVKPQPGRKARRQAVRIMIRAMAAAIVRELEPEILEGMLYGRGPFAPPPPHWHGPGLAELLRPVPYTQVPQPTRTGGIDP